MDIHRSKRCIGLIAEMWAFKIYPFSFIPLLFYFHEWTI